MLFRAQLVVLLAAVLIPSASAAGQAPVERDTAPVTTEMAAAITAGRNIFHGAGTCFACHGAKLEGTAIAPTLRDHKWRTGDGTLSAIIQIISHGVPKTVMVSHPGGISDAQLKQVASYVWAVSRGKSPP